jgi:UDP-N-acetyl-D-mannosaminuronic acid dehydrogenase
LGYVGLTLGVALARRGVKVFGIEKRPAIVDLTNRGIPHFSESGLDVALSSVVDAGLLIASETTEGVPPCHYYILTVGTPLRAGSYEPRLDMIEEATRQVADHFEDGATVILRSTVRIGTTRQIVDPVLRDSGKKYLLAMCPERTLEGDALRELAILPQIIGGMNDAASNKAATLFSILTNTTVRVTDPETAEMIKLVDNTSRDVRFAFANEVARACDAVGINANDVIRYGKLGYARTNVALPGLVGGPCLEKDPHILLASVAPYDITLEITAASRQVNERQPAETLSAILDRLSRIKEGPYTVTLAGMAFKGVPETDDLRGSMSLHLVRLLEERTDVREIRVYDSVVPKDALQALPHEVSIFGDFYDACTNADLVVIANNHPIFSSVDFQRVVSLMNQGGFMYDYWNNLGEQPPEVLGGRYLTVGNLVGKF